MSSFIKGNDGFRIFSEVHRKAEQMWKWVSPVGFSFGRAKDALDRPTLSKLLNLYPWWRSCNDCKPQSLPSNRFDSMLGSRGYPKTFARAEKKFLPIHLGVASTRKDEVTMLSTFMDIQLCLTPRMNLCKE